MNLATWFMSSGRTAACGTGKLRGKITCFIKCGCGDVHEDIFGLLLNVGVVVHVKTLTLLTKLCFYLLLWCCRLNSWTQGLWAREASTLSLVHPGFPFKFMLWNQGGYVVQNDLALTLWPRQALNLKHFWFSLDEHMGFRPGIYLLFKRACPIPLNSTLFGIYVIALHDDPTLSFCILPILLVKQN